jgi:hypothetical protein|tara:strand:- start:263 stop:520 length:258 start_codon:yes stop_codon:yes gene_type:complete
MRSQYNNELDEIREAIAKTFTGAYGEKVLQFLEDVYVNQLSAEPNDPYTTYFNEGGRGLVLGLKAQIYAYKHRDSKPTQQEEVQV